MLHWIYNPKVPSKGNISVYINYNIIINIIHVVREGYVQFKSRKVYYTTIKEP